MTKYIVKALIRERYYVVAEMPMERDAMQYAEMITSRFCDVAIVEKVRTEKEIIKKSKGEG